MALKRLEHGRLKTGRAICVAGLLLTGCATGENIGDVVDSGQADSAAVAPDASIADAGRSDAAVVDSGQMVPDSGQATVDAGQMMVDAMIPDASNCVVGPLQLLTNGNIDLGAVSWSETSGGGYPLMVDQSTVTGLTADTPTFVAWLGGYSPTSGVGIDTLIQDIVVPIDATPIVFAGKIRIATEETSSIPYDQLKLEILDSGTDVVLEQILIWSNDDANSAWETFSGTSVGNYAGQTIRVRFISTTDTSLNTSFFLDTLSASTTSCQ
ncbi:MAG: hypothetical protein JKY56_07710 [Kofleriaceae bacterium]|nr:hypothetical protein [Kofleriaceae bacterium]